MLLKNMKDKLNENTSFDEKMIGFAKENTLPFRTLMARYNCAMMEVETKFKVLNEEFSLEYDRNPIESIRTRLKEPEGILLKMKRKKLPLRIESIEDNIVDIAGIRVICSFKEDIYVLANCLLEQDDIKLIKIKDYIKEPKENGYRRGNCKGTYRMRKGKCEPVFLTKNGRGKFYNYFSY